MINLRNGCAVAALALALPVAAMSSGQAAPLAGHATSLSAVSVSNSDITEVRYRGRGWGGGAGVGLGLAAGALLGGAIAGANPYYYGPGYYYYGGPAYYPGPVVADPYDGGDAVAYCMQRYRSYDPASGTYLGYDGFRHPCP